MRITISILVFLLCLRKKNSKLILIFSLTWLWYLMVFSTGLADEASNISRFYNYDRLVGQTEIGYYYLMMFANKLGLSFDIYKGIIAAIELLLIGSTINKFSNNNAVIAAYLVYPFCMDIVQMRNTLSLAIIIFGLRYIMPDYENSDNERKNIIKYIVCVCIAGLFHSLNYFNLLLLLSKKTKTKTIIIYTVLFSGIFILFIRSNIIVQISSVIGIRDKIESIQSNGVEFALYINTLARVVSFFITFIVDYYYILKVIKYKSKKIDSSFVLNSNILILSIIALMNLSVDFYRLQTGLSIMNYLFFVQPLRKSRNGIINKKDLVLIMLFIFTCVTNLYWLVLRSNFDRVFRPVFLGFN